MVGCIFLFKKEGQAFFNHDKRDEVMRQRIDAYLLHQSIL